MKINCSTQKSVKSVTVKPTATLKVPKCEIFERSDFHDFYSIKPFWVGDFGAKIYKLVTLI